MQLLATRSDAKVLTGVLDALHHDRDDRLEVANANRLYKPTIKTGQPCLMFIDGTGTGYDQRASQRGHGPQPARDLVSVHGRHRDILQYQIRAQPRRKLECLSGAIRYVDTVAVGP